MSSETAERWDEPDPHSVVFRYGTKPAKGLSLNERMVHRPEEYRRIFGDPLEPLLDGASPPHFPIRVFDNVRRSGNKGAPDIC
jgi:hypothetical protein